MEYVFLSLLRSRALNWRHGQTSGMQTYNLLPSSPLFSIEQMASVLHALLPRLVECALHPQTGGMKRSDKHAPENQVAENPFYSN